MATKKYNQNPLFEYRVKYNAGQYESAENSYHYYQAENAGQALLFHNSMMERKKFDNQVISVERRCPYRNQWLDVTDEAILA